MKDLTFLKDSTGINNFIFIIDGLSPNTALKLSEEIIKQKFNFKWRVNMRFEKVIDKKLLKIVKLAGCSCIEFGLESGDQRINDSIEKGINLKDAERIIRLCKQVGIESQVNTILGFPNESPLNTFKTLKFLSKNKKFLNNVGIHKFTLLQGSKMHLRPERYGILKIDDIQQNKFKCKKHNLYRKYVINKIISLSRLYFNSLKRRL